MTLISLSGCPGNSAGQAELRLGSLLLLAWLWLPAAPLPAAGVSPATILEIQDHEGRRVAGLWVEIADTPGARERGLMGRELPDDQTAMLFIFAEAAPRAFWMRNTPAPLDMLFADAEGRIIHIARETQPFSDQHYASQGAARYVLETRGGFSARHGVIPGMKLNYGAGPLRRPTLEGKAATSP